MRSHCFHSESTSRDYLTGEIHPSEKRTGAVLLRRRVLGSPIGPPLPPPPWNQSSSSKKNSTRKNHYFPEETRSRGWLSAREPTSPSIPRHYFLFSPHPFLSHPIPEVEYDIEEVRFDSIRRHDNARDLYATILYLFFILSASLSLHSRNENCMEFFVLFFGST